MKKTMFLVALLAIPAVAFAGTATMALKLSDGTTAVSLPPAGGTITVAVWLNAYNDSGIGTWAGGNGIANVDGYIHASASGIFNIPAAASRVFVTPFSAGVGDLAAATNMSGALSPDSKNWGVAATGQVGAGADGNYQAPADGALPWKIETITMNVAGIPGVYTLALSTSPVSYAGSSDDSSAPVALDTTLLGPVTVTVTPEPVTMLLLAAALPFLRRRSA